MSWGVVTTDDFDVWLYGLREDQQAAVVARVDMLATSGPTLGRPTVDSIKGGRHHNMKELRCAKGGALRVLFIFDPLRQAVMLLGGDKSEDSQGNRWYAEAVSRADSLYDDHLAYLREEGLIE
jgi:hypothetical protein